MRKRLDQAEVRRGHAEAAEKTHQDSLFASNLIYAVLRTTGEDYAAVRWVLRHTVDLDGGASSQHRHPQDLQAGYAEALDGGTQSASDDADGMRPFKRAGKLIWRSMGRVWRC